MIILSEKHKPQSSHLCADVNAERGERRGLVCLDGQSEDCGSTEPAIAPYAIALQVHA